MLGGVGCFVRLWWVCEFGGCLMFVVVRSWFWWFEFGLWVAECLLCCC